MRPRRGKMPARQHAHLRQRGQQPGAHLPRHAIARPCPMPRQHITRHKNPLARRIPGEAAQHVRDPQRDARVACRVGAAGVGPIGEDQRRQPQRRGKTFAAIAFQRRRVGHRLAVEVEGMRVDEIKQRLERQLETLHRGAQCFGHGMPLPLRLRPQRIAPPLQADFAGHGVAHDVAYALNLMAKSVERVQVRAFVRRRKQAGKPAVACALLQQPPAFGIVSRPRHQSTASRAAATRRFSPSRML